MATITPTAEHLGLMTVWTWAGIVTGDTCTPVEVEHNPSDLIMQASGTFAGGTSVSMRGSLDNTNFVADLIDPGGTAIAITAANGSALRDGWRYLSPVVASGAADSVTVLLMARVTK